MPQWPIADWQKENPSNQEVNHAADEQESSAESEVWHTMTRRRITRTTMRQWLNADLPEEEPSDQEVNYAADEQDSSAESEVDSTGDRRRIARRKTR